MKFRRHKIKREHSIIKGALDWLEDLSRLKEVTDIIPGVINVTHSQEKGIAYQYETPTGCKLLLKNGALIQEAFVVTEKPQAVKAWVAQMREELDLLQAAIDKAEALREKEVGVIEATPVKKTEKRTPSRKKEEKEASNPLAMREKLVAGIKEDVRLVEINQGLRDSFVESLATMADLDNPKLADSLKPELKKALDNLQVQLKPSFQKKDSTALKRAKDRRKNRSSQNSTQ
ncbi:MAG: DUF2103 domain-containing protein [Desulfitobacteriia bacterium]|jgi:hypothetical protein